MQLIIIERLSSASMNRGIPGKLHPFPQTHLMLLELPCPFLHKYLLMSFITTLASTGIYVSHVFSNYHHLEAHTFP